MALAKAYRLVCNVPMSEAASPTRDRLLQAAYREIREHGFQAASVAAILSRSALTKGALYHHFRDKRALGFAVLDEVIAPYFEQNLFEPLRNSEDPLMSLQKLIRETARSHDSQSIRLGCPLHNLTQEMSALDDEFKTRLSRLIARWQRSMRDVLRRAQEMGKLKPGVDCEAAALFIVSAWEGCTGVAKNLQSEKVLAQCMRQLVHYVEALMPTPER